MDVFAPFLPIRVKPGDPEIKPNCQIVKDSEGFTVLMYEHLIKDMTSSYRCHKVTPVHTYTHILKHTRF